MKKFVFWLRKIFSFLFSTIGFFLVFIIFLTLSVSDISTEIFIIVLSLIAFLSAFFLSPKKEISENSKKSDYIWWLIKSFIGVAFIAVGGGALWFIFSFPFQFWALNISLSVLGIVLIGNGFRWYFKGIAGKSAQYLKPSDSQKELRKVTTQKKARILIGFLAAMVFLFLIQSFFEFSENKANERRISHLIQETIEAGTDLIPTPTPVPTPTPSPTPIPTSTPTPTPTPEPTPYRDPEESITVYITATGSKYHQRKCGKGNYYQTSLAEAKRNGYTPCGRCY